MKLTHYINSETVAAAASFDSINPSNTAEVVAAYPAGGAAEAIPECAEISGKRGL